MLLLIAALSVLMTTGGCSRTQEVSRGDCDINKALCAKTAQGGTLVAFDIHPKPVKAMADLLFTVVLTRGGEPIDRASANLDLSMPGMYMGLNRLALVNRGDGRFEGKGVIPRCVSGRKIWKARVEFAYPGNGAGNEGTAEFIFEVSR